MTAALLHVGLLAAVSGEMDGPLRVLQMMRQLEDEMNAMTRAFGLPALQTTFDLPSVAFPEVPATARALACDIQDKGDHIEVQADVPGMSKEDIKVGGCSPP